MFASHTNVGDTVVGVGAAEVTVRSVRAAVRIASDVMVFCGLKVTRELLPLLSRFFLLHF